ncbi:MAG: pyridoxamine 5'-phosphate oxidase family protein, partial [Planctomycetota bacterium]
MAIQDLRQNYTPEPIDPEDLLGNPFDQFLAWFEDAKDAGILEPNAFTLATADADGTPNARTLLLKGVDDPPRESPETPEPHAITSGGRGLVFYTNYNSSKGDELAANPRACMNFYWDTLARCVRIPGTVTKVSAEETAAYFKTRPRESQLGAWTSHQSSVINGREDLMLKFFQLTE